VIAENLVGKKKRQITEYLRSAGSVGSAKVKFVPFWIKKAPNHADKIAVDIVYD